MADLTNDIRLAVDTGKTKVGFNKVVDSIKDNTAKLVVLAKVNDSTILDDIKHLTKVSDIKLLLYDGNSMELGALCGKPFSVSVLSVIEAGSSGILKDDSK